MNKEFDFRNIREFRSLSLGRVLSYVHTCRQVEQEFLPTDLGSQVIWNLNLHLNTIYLTSSVAAR